MDPRPAGSVSLCTPLLYHFTMSVREQMIVRTWLRGPIVPEERSGNYAYNTQRNGDLHRVICTIGVGSRTFVTFRRTPLNRSCPNDFAGFWNFKELISVLENQFLFMTELFSVTRRGSKTRNTLKRSDFIVLSWILRPTVHTMLPVQLCVVVMDVCCC